MKNLAITTLALLALVFTAPSCSDVGAASGDAVQKTVKGLLDQIGNKITDVKDTESAKTANTEISKIADSIKSKITGVVANAMPADAMTKVKELIGAQVPGLISKITNLSPELKDQLSGALAKLKSLTEK